MRRRTPVRLREIAAALAVVAALAASIGVAALPSTAKFTRSDTSVGTFSSDTVKPVTGLAVTSDNFDELNLSWAASTTSYVTGYKVYRATTSTGPWTLVGTIGSPATTTYTDVSTSITRWYYRVDSIARNWIGPSLNALAPVAKGSVFTDGFDNTAQTNIDGQMTDTGSCVWKVIAGGVVDGRNSGAYGLGSGVSIAVVETATQNAKVTARGLDGIEAIVARAKDANNYIWVGGTGTAGSFEVAEVRNGIRTVLQSATIAQANNIRLELVGDTYTVYEGVADNTTGGTVLMTVKSSFLLGVAGANNFGMGFANYSSGIAGYIFTSLP